MRFFKSLAGQIVIGAVAGVGTIALRTFTWMIGFSIVAAGLAYTLGLLFQPGTSLPAAPEAATGGADAAQPATWEETLVGFVTTNVFEAMASATMVSIIVFSLIFGIALNKYIRTTGKTEVLTFAEQVQQVVLIGIQIVMRIAPIGVFALLASLTGEAGLSVIAAASKYLGATLAGVLILFALFVAVVAVRTGLNPLRLTSVLAEQTVIAVTTTSTAVTFPTVLKNTVEKAGVSQRVANFTLSVGLTMGSYGAVLNYMIVVMFLAQSGDVPLSFGDIAMGMGLAILLNMGTITVPGGFPVIALFLGTTLELPLESVGLLIAVDWFAGIFRTFLNVNGDTLVAMLVANASDEIDADVYYGRKQVTAEELTVDPKQLDDE